jgi:hypothetical protein
MRYLKLNSLKHIIIKRELYRAQNGLTQCYNCLNFGHVWINCKEPPRCLWCVGGHLLRECPEKTNTESKPSYCNCTIVEGDTPHPPSDRGCSHAKGELQKRRAQRAPNGSSGRMFLSKFTSPEKTHTAALRHDTQQATTGTTDRLEKRSAPRPAACHNRKFKKQVCQYSIPGRLTMKRLK